ncbi:MAG: sigma-70 family RNA polymerase sigma factor [Planctomycetes bacterium]|nr:sigma-70 family RNA polymerase sigma factor [Planctomycetota bacterium]
MTDVTRILNAIEQGDARATEKLLPLVYEELRLLAARKMAQEQPGQTLQATALVHEAYIRLVEGADQNWNSRGHFFKAAAEAMRRILVENARRKGRIKHGGGFQRVELSESAPAESDGHIAYELIALDEALDRFAQKDKLKADLVKLRYFAGLTIPQAAQILNISHATAERHWIYARCWLRAEIDRQRNIFNSK